MATMGYIYGGVPYPIYTRGDNDDFSVPPPAYYDVSCTAKGHQPFFLTQLENGRAKKGRDASISRQQVETGTCKGE